MNEAKPVRGGLGFSRAAVVVVFLLILLGGAALFCLQRLRNRGEGHADPTSEHTNRETWAETWKTMSSGERAAAFRRPEFRWYEDYLPLCGQAMTLEVLQHWGVTRGRRTCEESELARIQSECVHFDCHAFHRSPELDEALRATTPCVG